MEMLRRSSVFAAEVFDRSPTDKELVSQGKALCRDYIHSRLHRAGIGWTKAEQPGTLAEVSSVLLWLGDELEYLRPNVYRNVARQLNITVASESVVSDAFLAVAADIFSTGRTHTCVTWGKVVSLYAVAGALAVDCVRHGHPAMVHTIVDCMGEFVRKSLTSWLKKRGGWTDLTKCVVNTDSSFRSHWLVSAACTCGHYMKAVVLYILRE
uniref:Bcl-2 Bcl-2 homology region 1-3 domain-containing protein n=1 Tax=Gouania willdenowi TaxID=441366 RepID=A0A8C5GDW0_GOUWI